MSNEAKEEFLRTAVPVKASRAGKGVTETWRVTLEGSGMTHAASFQYVDERAAVKNLPDGTKELHFVDSYRYNIAGYRLANLLGLDNLVPVSVERTWRGKRGAMTWWVDDVMMDEAGMNERDLRAPDQAAWSRQTYRVRVFNELIYDTDRNKSNLLITNDWNIWLIDFSRAFRRWKKIRKPERSPPRWAGDTPLAPLSDWLQHSSVKAPTPGGQIEGGKCAKSCVYYNSAGGTCEYS